MLAAACTTVIAEAHRTAALCSLARHSVIDTQRRLSRRPPQQCVRRRPTPESRHAASTGDYPNPIGWVRADFGALRLTGILTPNLLATGPGKR
jgi:hypothetical protein